LSLFVDTSVWSLAFRRYAPVPANERRELVRAIEAGEEIVTTGLVLQELLLLRAEEPGRKSSIGSSCCRCWFPTGVTMWKPPN
jgi:hypothetical protein